MGTVKNFERIASGKTFDRVYKHPHKVWHTPYFVIFYQQCPCREVAFVASKKLGKAVQRNRAKRLLRAHFIEAAHTLPSGRYVFVAKAPLLHEPYQSIHSSFLHALKRCTASRRINDTTSKRKQ